MMWIILFIGAVLGVFQSLAVNKILAKIYDNKHRKIDFWVIAASSSCILLAYMKVGLNTRIIYSVVLYCVLIVISFVDLKCRVIPDFMVAVTLAISVMFIYILKLPIINSVAGMLVGGGILFLLALIPGVMGGGDVKLMFALGAFLGVNKILYAIVIAFICASIISILLLIFKVVGRKDHIPFGPFLAIGSFISFLFIK